NWYNNVKANSKRLQPLKTHGIEYAGSIEGGYAWKFNCFTVEPQGQIVYQSLSLHDSEDIAAKVDFHRTHSVLGRLGVRLANTWSLGCLPSSQPRQVTAWLRTDIWRDFNGKSKTFFSSEDGPVGIASDIGGNWFEGTLGVTAQITDALSFHGSFT